MANTDIRISIGFWDHPKTIKLERRLGMEGVKGLLVLWQWVAQYQPTGNLYGMDSEGLEIAARWTGEQGKFTETVIELRFVDLLEDAPGYEIHDWEIHNSWAADAQNREDKARFSALKRWNKKAYNELKTQGIEDISKEDFERLKKTKDKSLNGSVVGTHYVGNAKGIASGNAPSPSPSPKPKDQVQKQDQKTPASASDASPSKAVPETPAESPSSDGGARLQGGRGKGESDPFEAEIAEYFKQFWGAYPRKVDKKAAEKAFMALFKAAGKSKKTAVLANMEQHLQDYLDDVRDSDQKFMKHPATWLRAQDFLEPPPKPPDEKPKPEFVPYPLSPEEAEVERITNEKALKAFEERMKPGRRWIPEAKGDELPP